MAHAALFYDSVLLFVQVTVYSDSAGRRLICTRISTANGGGDGGDGDGDKPFIYYILLFKPTHAFSS